MFHIEPGVGMVNESRCKALVERRPVLGSSSRTGARHPQDDIFTDLVEAEITDERRLRRLTDVELADFGLLLFSAGSETVARLLGWAARC